MFSLKMCLSATLAADMLRHSFLSSFWVILSKFAEHGTRTMSQTRYGFSSRLTDAVIDRSLPSSRILRSTALDFSRLFCEFFRDSGEQLEVFRTTDKTLEEICLENRLAVVGNRLTKTNMIAKTLSKGWSGWKACHGRF